MTHINSGLYSVSTTVFQLSGENTKRWCNGMFSNNFRRMQSLDAHRSAICDDRGRVQGFIDAICIDDNTFLCALDGTSFDWFTGRFQMYMMLDDIEVEEISEEVLHVLSIQDLESLGLPVPEVHSAMLHEGTWIVHRPRLREQSGFDIICGPDSTLDVNNLKATLPVLTAETWLGLRIDTRTPEFPTDFTDKSFIHDFDLQGDVCSFNKGCYVGQEIINRMDIKALANKKLLQLEQRTGSWSIGAEVTLDGKSVGVITAVHPNKPMALAVLKKSAWSAGTLLVGTDFEAVVLTT